MKYSINLRQPRETLRKASEIHTTYKDIQGIYNLLDEEYFCKEVSYTIEIEPEDEINWNVFADLAAAGLTIYLALHDLKLVARCRENSLNWYWAYPIQSFYDLAGIRNLSPSFYLLDAPLYFDLKRVKSLIGDVPIRLIANCAHSVDIPRGDGVCGTYIRPEDVHIYEPYVDTLEFKTYGPWDERLRKERTLLEIYSKESWAGNLNLILTNFNINVDNRAFPPEFGEARLQCRQACTSNITTGCQLCYNVIKAINKFDQNKDNWIPGKGWKKI